MSENTLWFLGLLRNAEGIAAELVASEELYAAYRRTSDEGARARVCADIGASHERLVALLEDETDEHRRSALIWNTGERERGRGGG